MHFDALDEVWSELTAPGARYETETMTISGVTCLAYKHAPASLREVWLASCGAFADRDYLVYDDERITYGEARKTCDSIGAWLRSKGLGRGDRVAIAMRNYPEWMLIYWACVACGITVCGFNAWWSAHEMRQAYAETRPKAIFVDRERLERLRQFGTGEPDGLVVTVRCPAVSDSMETAWSEIIVHPAEAAMLVISAEDDACIFYTSGTSGKPKGAVLSHRNCITNIYNVLFAAEVQTVAAARASGRGPVSSGPPIVLVTTPLFHVTGNNCGAHVATALGGTIALMYKWDAGTAIDLIERERVTMMSGTPVMHREVVMHPRFTEADLSSLAAFSGGGASLPPDILSRIEASALTARVSSGYGMTETSGVITSITGDFFVAKPTSCGRLMPTFEARCLDDEGRDVPQGEPGELLLRGASVIGGYLGDSNGTSDGWLHTGDVVRIDEDGFVHIVDRKKDMILRGGENISCVEVEAELYSLPEVAECAVFGVPDERLGEIVGAAIYPHDGASLSAQNVHLHCAGRIAAYKIPERIWILDAPIPRNASGKLLKRELSRSLLENAVKPA